MILVLLMVSFYAKKLITYIETTKVNKTIVLHHKMLQPEKSWTDITYENGYYEQSHFIKEVNLFSGKSPEELFNTTPPPKEKVTELTEH